MKEFPITQISCCDSGQTEFSLNQREGSHPTPTVAPTKGSLPSLVGCEAEYKHLLRAFSLFDKSDQLSHKRCTGSYMFDIGSCPQALSELKIPFLGV